MFESLLGDFKCLASRALLISIISTHTHRLAAIDNDDRHET